MQTSRTENRKQGTVFWIMSCLILPPVILLAVVSVASVWGFAKKLSAYMSTYDFQGRINAILRAEADELLDARGLRTLLEEYAPIHVTGSYASG